MQRGALIAFALGMITPDAAGILRRMQVNAAACSAEMSTRQLLGLDPRDPQAIAVNALSCASAGAVADSIFSSLHKVTKRLLAIEGVGGPLRSTKGGADAAIPVTSDSGKSIGAPLVPGRGKIGNNSTIGFVGERDFTEAERTLFSALIRDTDVVAATLERVHPSISWRIEDIKEVKLAVHSTVGLNRIVYRVECHFENMQKPLVFIAKVARPKSIDALDQAILTSLTNGKLNRIFGVITNLADGRIVVTGPLVKGRMLSEFLTEPDPDPFIIPTVAEAVRVWHKLGGFFISDPHSYQFLIDESGGKITSTLIDKGSFSRAGRIDFGAVKKDSGQIVFDFAHTSDFKAWLKPTTEVDLVDRLIGGLSSPPPNQGLAGHFVDPDEEMIGLVNFARSSPVTEDAVVQGVIDALGRDASLTFFTRFIRDQSKTRIRNFLAIEQAIFRRFPELVSDRLHH